jgi:hypothetical protein
MSGAAAARHGLVVTEVLEVDADLGRRLAALSARWEGCKASAGRPMLVYARHHEEFLQFPPSEGVDGGSAAAAVVVAPARLFVAADAAGALAGFLLADPLREGGEAAGYVTSSCHMDPAAHSGTQRLLQHAASEAFRAEGVRTLSLGVAPLLVPDAAAACRPAGLPAAGWLAFATAVLFERGSALYAFKSLAFGKLRAGGGLDGATGWPREGFMELRPLYVLHSSPAPLGFGPLDVIVLLIHLGIVPGLLATLRAVAA